MGGNRWGTCKLCIRVHTSQGICKAIGSRACSHVIRMEGTSGTAAWCNWEVFLACFCPFLLICTCYRMLEPGRIRRISCDGNVYIFFPHDSHSFRNGVRTIAVDLSTEPFGIRLAFHLVNGVGIRIIFCFHKGKPIDPGDNLSSVLSKAIQDNAQRFLADFICLFSDTDRAFRCSEGFMSCQECKALCLFL